MSSKCTSNTSPQAGLPPTTPVKSCSTSASKSQRKRALVNHSLCIRQTSPNRCRDLSVCLTLVDFLPHRLYLGIILRIINSSPPSHRRPINPLVKVKKSLARLVVVAADPDLRYIVGEARIEYMRQLLLDLARDFVGAECVVDPYEKSFEVGQFEDGVDFLAPDGFDKVLVGDAVDGLSDLVVDDSDQKLPWDSVGVLLEKHGAMEGSHVVHGEIDVD